MVNGAVKVAVKVEPRGLSEPVAQGGVIAKQSVGLSQIVGPVLGRWLKTTSNSTMHRSFCQSLKISAWHKEVSPWTKKETRLQYSANRFATGKPGAESTQKKAKLSSFA